MKYLHFIQTARTMRRRATPAEPLCPPEDRPEKLPVRCPRRRIAALTAAAAVAAVVLAGGGVWLSRTAPVTPGSDTPPHKTGGIAEEKLHTEVRLAALAGQDTPTPLAVYAGVLTFNAGKGGTAADHEGCSCVVYSAADGTVFCPTHALQELLAGKIQGEIRVKHLSIPLGRVLFTAGSRAYFYDLNTAELNAVPTDLSSTATVMAGDAADFEKEYCILEGNGSGDRSTYYLVSMRARTVENLERAGADGSTRLALDTSAKISKGGQFAAYILDNDKANTTARTNVLIHLATRAVHTFTGELLDSTPDDRYFVAMADGGLSVYDTAAGRETPFADSGCPLQYRYGLRQLKTYQNSFYADYALLDRLTGAETPISGHPSASALSRDGTTAYVFDRNKTAIDAYDFLAGEWYTLPLSEEFLTLLQENAAKEIHLYFCTNTDGSVTLTYYVTHLDRVTPEEQMAEEAKYPSSMWYEMLTGDAVVSIASLRPLVEKYYPNGSLALYEGAGYAYLEVADFWRSGSGYPSFRTYAIEDYSAGWFYLMDESGTQQQVLCANRLSADASQKTAALAADCHMPKVTATRDFPYLKDGTVDAKGLTESLYTSAHILSGNVSYSLFPERSDAGWITNLDHPEDIAALRNFLTFVDRLPFTDAPLDNGYASRFAANEMYIVRIRRSSPDAQTPELFNFAFGRTRSGGYEMLYLAQDGGHLVSITAEEYARWKPWAEACIRRQNIPYEQR